MKGNQGNYCKKITGDPLKCILPMYGTLGQVVQVPFYGIGYNQKHHKCYFQNKTNSRKSAESRINEIHPTYRLRREKESTINFIALVVSCQLKINFVVQKFGRLKNFYFWSAFNFYFANFKKDFHLMKWPFIYLQLLQLKYFIRNY